MVDLSGSFKNIEQEMLITGLHLDDYDYIINNLDKIDSKEFQTKFDYFFKVRKNEDWRKIYFDLFDEVYHDKSKQEFEYIIKQLFERAKKRFGKGSIEPSFASKMLHCINTDEPIWDKFVISYVKMDDIKNNNTIQNCINNYDDLRAKYEKLLNDKKILNNISVFKSIVTKYRISNLKILDFMIWSSRDNDTK